MKRARIRSACLAACALAIVLGPACSIREYVVVGLADSLSQGGDVFASDDDPELVREALPFALKSMEALLLEAPQHEGLLLACCRSFTQYSRAFVAADADRVEDTDYAAAEKLRERALKLYLRARDYGLRALELRHAGITSALRSEPDAAVAVFDAAEVGLIFWTGVAWAGALSVGLDRPEIVADVDAPRALLRRTLELDEGFDDGAVHEVMIVMEALPSVMGGSMERARAHFERAIELSRGMSASPYVTMAEAVHVPTQNRHGFRAALAQALAIDPDRLPTQRLANVLAQDRARFLLEREDMLFLEPLE